jgi:hypothetical protein
MHRTVLNTTRLDKNMKSSTIIFLIQNALAGVIIDKVLPFSEVPFFFVLAALVNAGLLVYYNAFRSAND